MRNRIATEEPDEVCENPPNAKLIKQIKTNSFIYNTFLFKITGKIIKFTSIYHLCGLIYPPH